jgi:FkbM family methyltransferase
MISVKQRIKHLALAAMRVDPRFTRTLWRWAQSTLPVERVAISTILDTRPFGCTSPSPIHLDVEFPANDGIILEALINDRVWEPAEVKSVIAAMSPGRSYDVLDVGANVGLFSIQLELLRRFCRPDLIVDQYYLFEPVRSVFRCLRNNVVAAGIANCRSYEVALGEANKSASIALDPGNAGNNSLFDEAVPMQAPAHAQIAMETLSALAQRERLEFSRPIILKLDVQGYEPQVVHGIDAEVWDRVEIAVIEITPRLLNKCEPGLLARFLDRLGGFAHHAIEERGEMAPASFEAVLRLVRDRELSYCNICAVR